VELGIECNDVLGVELFFLVWVIEGIGILSFYLE